MATMSEGAYMFEGKDEHYTNTKYIYLKLEMNMDKHLTWVSLKVLDTWLVSPK